MNGRKAVRAALLPDEKPLSLSARGDYAELTVPRVDIFSMLMLLYE